MVSQRAACLAEPARRAGQWRILSRLVESNAAASAGSSVAGPVQGLEFGFAGDPCKHRFSPGAWPALSLRPARRAAAPPYRFFPSDVPQRLVTNQMGWRGPPIEYPRGPEDDPHRLRRLLDGDRRTLGALLVSGVRRLLAEPVGEGKEARRALRGAELGAREQRLDRHRPHRPHRGAAASGPTSSSTTRAATSSGPSRSSRRCRRRRRTAAGRQRRRRQWLRAASRWSALAGRVQAAIGLAPPTWTARNGPSPTTRSCGQRASTSRTPTSTTPPAGQPERHRARPRPDPRRPRRHRQRVRAELLRLDGEGRAGARSDAPPLHPRAAQRLELPVPLPRPRAAGEVPEPPVRQVRARARTDLRRHRRASCRSIPTSSSTRSTPAMPARA